MMRHGPAKAGRHIFGALLAVFALATPPAPVAQTPRDFDVLEKTIPELQAAMAAGTVTSKQLVSAYLARIKAYDHDGPRLSAMIALNPRALDAADALDQERAARGPRGPLHGIPVVIKDNFETADMPTTGGSIALAGFETGRDAFQVRKLREAGAVIVGKTNLHELASGITTISSLGGQTRNPYDPRRNPGGSSGGTAAAIAANFAAAGMGSDTCGSIRIPAANNNLFGLRGTLGLSSRDGIIPLSHTQDIGGPLARDVTDLAIMLDATVGADAGDPATSASRGHVPASYREALRTDSLKGVRIGILKNNFGAAPEDEEAGAIVRHAIDAMQKQGADTVDVTVPGLEDLVGGSSVIDAEFKFDLMDYLARSPNAPVRSLGDILARGAYHASLDSSLKRRNAVEARETETYRRARIKRDAVRAVILATMDEQRLDALAYPVLRRKPAIVGEPQRGGENCQLSPSTGLPAMSMPAGFTSDGLPIGVELLGAAWRESQLLTIAYAYEQAVHPRRPPTATPALVNGKAPSPVSLTVNVGSVRAVFVFDPMSGRLLYESTAASPVLTAAVHRGAADQTGPAVVTVLTGASSNESGDVTLLPVDREALASGRLYLAVRAKAKPDQVLRAQMVVGK
jgi:Asp-tRNA(Asn)/Glu-tRNA(Gln) amidotransferase A subunit family amidase